VKCSYVILPAMVERGGHVHCDSVIACVEYPTQPGDGPGFVRIDGPPGADSYGGFSEEERADFDRRAMDVASVDNVWMSNNGRWLAYKTALATIQTNGDNAFPLKSTVNGNTKLYRALTVAQKDTAKRLMAVQRRQDGALSKPFAVGRRWRCTMGTEENNRATFDFVILGDGENYSGNPSKVHKRCKLEVLPEHIEQKRNGYKSHGTEGTYSHAHLKNHATLLPVS
jgi:hypothetical protein